MIEFFLIVLGVTATLMFLSWKPVHQALQALLGLYVFAFIIFVISLVIWLALKA